MRLLIGTQNPAKFARYKAILHEIPGLNVVSPADIGLTLSIVEDGASAADNARIKARAYAQATGLPTLGIDEALYMDALPPDEQPGTYVRRFLGYAASDEELLHAFLEKVRRLTLEERAVTWVYAVCLAMPDGRELQDQAEIPAVFIDQPVMPLLPGYPLSSILFNTEIGKAHREMSPAEERQRLMPLCEKIQAPLRSEGLEGPPDRRCRLMIVELVFGEFRHHACQPANTNQQA